MITLTALLLGTALWAPTAPPPADLGPQVDPQARPLLHPFSGKRASPASAARSRRTDGSLRDPFGPEAATARAPVARSALRDPFRGRTVVARPAPAPETLRSPFRANDQRPVVEQPAPAPGADLRDPFA